MSGRLTIGRWLADRARTTPDRVAIDYHDRELDYRELDDASTRFAASFAERGLQRGDRVATLTGNTPEHVAVFFACAKARADPRAAQLAACRAGARVPARRRGAGAVPRRGRVRGARGRDEPASFEPLRVPTQVARLY